jgi:uncharacterized protein (TIGR02271 family)
MQHTLVAVFDNRSDAQQALEELVSSGFSRQSARLSEDDSSSLTGSSSDFADTTSAPGSTINTNLNASPTQANNDGTIGGSIRNFFSDLFGGDRDHDVNLYSNAVNRGHFVLTVTADSEPEVERAADIVERYGPIDIDEHSDKWGGDNYRSDTLRTGAGSLGGAAMSQQSYQSDSLQTTTQSGSQMRAENSIDTSSRLSGSQQRAETRTQDTQSIPVIQEQLAVGKREVQRGGVRVYSRMVETPVNESVSLREEHVNVERHPVDRPIGAGDLDAFKESSIEMRETSEEAVVQKSARVVEEVTIGKDVSQRTQNITDSVRRTEVEVEQLSPDDDNYYRSHYTSNFSSEGRYEDYEPAYRYGSSMARHDSYRGRSWDDAEPTLRSDWETRNPGSAWERFKAAVRHGWDRMTS